MENNGYSQDFITKLKSNNNIVSVITKYVPLSKKGRTYWGCCPFHHEKTPSFAVNDVEQYYHCFGCGQSGDVIGFIEKIEGVDFMQAVKSLAESANMELPKFMGDKNIVKRKKEKDLMISICTEAARYYHNELLKPVGQVAINYLKKRQVSDETISKMGLGYSSSWQGIITYLKQKGYSESQQKKSGILGEKDGRLYDAMAERLVFPIINHLGKVVGFSGRALKDGTFAKYKNTEATEIFNKSTILYNLNSLRKARIDNKNYAIMCEGQMDVVSLCQSGFYNAIATLGTAFNENHINSISKFVDSIYICFDGDGAGKKAAEKSIEVLKDSNFDVKVVTLPEKLDPDEYIKKYGSESFEQQLQNAKTVKEFQIECLAEKFDLSNKNSIPKFVDKALELISSYNSVTERDMYLKVVSQKCNMNEEILRRELNKIFRNKENTYKEQKQIKNAIEAQTNKLAKAEQFVISCRLYKKPFTTDIKSDLFENNFYREFNQYLIDKNPIISQVLDDYNIDNNSLLYDIVNFDYSKIKNEEQEYKGCLNQLELRKLYKKQTDLQIRLQTAKQEEQNAILTELQSTIKEIQKKKVED